MLLFLSYSYTLYKLIKIAKLFQWLMSENIVPCLANLFKPEHGADVHCNVSQLLCDVVRTDRDSLLDHPDTNCLLTALETPETIRLILENILSEPRTESSLVGGVQFLLVLFDQSGRFVNISKVDAYFFFIACTT